MGGEKRGTRGKNRIKVKKDKRRIKAHRSGKPVDRRKKRGVENSGKCC